MKATIDIPDEIYRRVKARSAMLGLAVREVTIELYQRWLGETQGAGQAPSSDEWLDEWLRTGDAVLRDAPEGPTATEILHRDRNRLEHR